MYSILGSKKKDKRIEALLDEEGNRVTSLVEKLEVARKYWEKMLTVWDTQKQKWMATDGVRKVSNLHASMLDEPLKSEEAWGVLTEMKADKTPGPDGLPVEVYKK